MSKTNLRPPKILRRRGVGTSLWVFGWLTLTYGSASLALGPLSDPLAVLRPGGGQALGLSGADALNVFSIGFALLAAGHPWLVVPWIPEGKNSAFNVGIWWWGAFMIFVAVSVLVIWSTIQIIPTGWREYQFRLFLGPENGALVADFLRAGLAERFSAVAVPIGAGVAALALTEAEDDAR